MTTMIDSDSDRFVIWGCGQSNVQSVRVADSDLDAYPTASARRWLDAHSDIDDVWCVSIPATDELAEALDRDPATAGYEVFECNGC